MWQAKRKGHRTLSRTTGTNFYLVMAKNTLAFIDWGLKIVSKHTLCRQCLRADAATANGPNLRTNKGLTIPTDI